jgi:hypothetical protein
MKTSQTITAIAPALVAALAEIEAVRKDSQNPFLKNKYASLDAIIAASKPVLFKHKLAAMQIVNDDGVETIIMHESGEWVGSEYIKIFPEVSKGLSAAQAVGVATTYAKRYQLGAILNISTDEDTDGQYGDNKELKPAKTKPALQTDDLEKIKGIAKTIKAGAFKIEDYRKKYDISKECELLIAGEVQKLQEADNAF